MSTSWQSPEMVGIKWNSEIKVSNTYYKLWQQLWRPIIIDILKRRGHSTRPQLVVLQNRHRSWMKSKGEKCNLSAELYQPPSSHTVDWTWSKKLPFYRFYISLPPLQLLLRAWDWYLFYFCLTHNSWTWPERGRAEKMFCSKILL